MMNYKSNPFYVVGAAALFFCAPVAMANGGHFLVDDATVTDPGTCQVETWLSRVDSQTTTFFVPACTTQQGWEFSLPVTYDWSDSELAAFGLEAKTVIAANQHAALAFSAGIEMDQVSDKFAGGFINIPVSLALSGPLQLHLNVGSAYVHDSRDWEATYGVATTYGLSSTTTLILEAAAIGNERPVIAAGLRHAFERVELDTSVARDRENRATIYTIGLNIAF